MKATKSIQRMRNLKKASSNLSRSTRNSYNRRLITFTDDISDCFTVRITDYQ